MEWRHQAWELPLDEDSLSISSPAYRLSLLLSAQFAVRLDYLRRSIQPLEPPLVIGELLGKPADLDRIRLQLEL